MNWRPAHLWRKLATGFVTITLAWLVFLAVSIIRYAGESDPGPADAAIVLGAAVTDNAPTPVFEQRIQHAVDLYHAGTVRVLVLTGGLGAGDTLAESEVARQYCLAHGVGVQDLFIETQSHSTRENLEQAHRLLAEHGLRRALIVSDPLHMRRAVTEARDVGIDAYPSPTPTSRYLGLASRGRFVAREVYFYARYLIYRTLANATAQSFGARECDQGFVNHSLSVACLSPFLVCPFVSTLLRGRGARSPSSLGAQMTPRA